MNTSKSIKHLRLRLASTVVLLANLSGCVGGPPPAIYANYDDVVVASTSVAANVHGADVYWGATRDNISSHVGVTPYTHTVHSTSNVWPAGYYKIVQAGYKPAIIKVAPSDNSRRHAATLLPLPKHPAPPKFTSSAAKELAILPLEIEAIRKPSFYIKKADTIAVIAFAEPDGSGAGSLVADNLILDLLVKGYNVVDREQVEGVLRNQGLLVTGKSTLADPVVAKKLAQLIDADYIIYGAIAEYVSQSENIKLIPQVEPKDRHRYQQEREAFMGFYHEFANDFDRLPTMPKSLTTWELDAARNANSAYLHIARVGVQAEIINLKSADVVWTGFASLQDLRIQAGMRRLVRGLNRSFISEP